MAKSGPPRAEQFKEKSAYLLALNHYANELVVFMTSAGATTEEIMAELLKIPGVVIVKKD